MATCATGSKAGYLPNNVIRKARDSDKLDGLDSTLFEGRNAAATANPEPDAVITSNVENFLQLGHDQAIAPASLTRVAAIASVSLRNDGLGSVAVQCRLAMGPLNGTLAAISQVATIRAPQSSSVQVTLVGAELGSPGVPYDIAVQCWDPSGDNAWKFASGDLVALAVR
jgi:hypothetical protein